MKRLILPLICFLICLTGCAKKNPLKNQEFSLDLSTWESTFEDSVFYDETQNTLRLKDCEYFQLELPEELAPDQTVLVTLKGINNGTSGFRSWIVNYSETSQSNLYVESIFEKLKSGEFEIRFELTTYGTGSCLFIKGPQWGTSIDDITFTNISVKYR